MIICLLILLMFVSVDDASAHQRARYDIVIDTDCGKDDFRALTYFFSSRDFNINAISTVGGVLDAETSAQCVSSLLCDFHHEGIMLQKGQDAKAFKKNCADALSFWKRNLCLPLRENAVCDAIVNNDKSTVYVALGPLSNLAALVDNHPEVLSKISYVLWSTDFASNAESGFNCYMDKKAYEKVVASGLKIRMVESAKSSYPADFLSFAQQINTCYARTFCSYYNGKSIADEVLCDDVLPFYILYPELFDEQSIAKNVSLLTPKSNFQFDILATRILNSIETEKGVILNELPRSGYMLSADVEPLAAELIGKYGYSEFKLVLLTSEMHSHLGIYSIIGAKLGLRILEYLHVGLDEIHVESNAGSEPPLSCLNDGLQIGAGTTMGYGAIRISDVATVNPSVVVHYNGRMFLLKLKDSVVSEISADVQALVAKYGIESDVYWSEIRRLSIEKYWLGKNRFEIFEIEPLSF